MPEQHIPTYCRICEPLCGLVATVEDGRVTNLRPDKNHPITRGFACPKGIAMTEVHNDPRRVLHPMRRQADGTFVRVSWPEALSDIGERLRHVRARHGNGAIGVYAGNASAFSYSAIAWFKGMVDALGTRHVYSAGSQDTNSRFAASALLYGSPLTVPVPDLHRTELLFMLGANPIVSHGSLISGTNVRDALNGIVQRGGRIIVVDPRRTETARLFEHIPVRPDTDAWLLLSLLNVMLADELEDRSALAGIATGMTGLRRLVAQFTPELTEPVSGVPADRVRMLAHELAASPSAAFYGRVGACTGSFGTLVCFLLDALNAVTGNLDTPGGAVFPTPPIDIYGSMEKRGLATYDTWRSRVGGLPEVLGAAPAAVMADEIMTPGEGQLKALITVAGNPVLTVPDGPSLGQALDELSLFVSLDIGFNDTNRHADYILPATTFLEREDMGVQVFPYQLQTFVQWTEAVVPPRAEARQEWQIIRDLCAELGIVPSSAKEMRRLGRLGRMIGPRPLFDAMLRLGPYGDRFGLRRNGISIRKLRRHHPHGVVLAAEVPTGVLPDRITRPDRRIDLSPQAITREVERLRRSSELDPDFPFRLFGRRELRSINSWMKNVAKLTAGGSRGACLIHPDDARELGLGEDEKVRISSRVGSVEAEVVITDDVVSGSVCLPHGWGQGIGVGGEPGGIGGPNYNTLTEAGPLAVEPLAGMSVLNGIPVRLERASAKSATDGNERVANVTAGATRSVRKLASAT
jgi:anaerobic selenocysteine-containing dehydrogenase